ncbi:MAG: GUN4 domain-containing protein [Heteroscytonema crispum UTEX LB 1556]
MKIQIKQIKQFFLLINRLSLAQKIISAIFIFALAQAVLTTVYAISKNLVIYVLENYQQILAILAICLGIILFGMGFYLYFVKYKRKQSKLDNCSDGTSSSNQDAKNESLTLYTEGNYNENVHGNYIEVHGNYIDINSDFSEVAAQIRELINQLKNEGYSQENAETKIANELAEEASKNPKVKKKIYKWRKSFSSTNTKINDDIEIAREVVKSATSYSYSSSKDFTEVVGGYYQKLDELLQAKKWEEADCLTAEIIYEISQDKLPEPYLYGIYHQNYVIEEHLKVIPRKDLSTIDKLWVKHSNGRFGFSVQKKIWKSLGGGSDTNYTPFGVYRPYGVEEKFGDIVGWRKEGNWLYYVDLYDSLRTAPRGHLPLALMLHSGKSERCSEIDFSILEVIVGRL